MYVPTLTDYTFGKSLFLILNNPAFIKKKAISIRKKRKKLVENIVKYWPRRKYNFLPITYLVFSLWINRCIYTT